MSTVDELGSLDDMFFREEIGFKGLFGAQQHEVAVGAGDAGPLHTSTLTDLDSAFPTPLFVHGDPGGDALLHCLDMANDTNLTALGLQAFQCINSQVQAARIE